MIGITARMPRRSARRPRRGWCRPPAADLYTVSVDEKPGVQALSTTGADLPPVAGKHASVGRDCEYVRHGTLSIIAALGLHTGKIIANVESRHRSVEFIGLPESAESLQRRRCAFGAARSGCRG